jgi:hypothetical protein
VIALKFHYEVIFFGKNRRMKIKSFAMRMGLSERRLSVKRRKAK